MLYINQKVESKENLKLFFLYVSSRNQCEICSVRGVLAEGAQFFLTSPAFQPAELHQLPAGQRAQISSFFYYR